MTKDHGYYRRAAFLFVPERERFAREVFRICHIRVLASLIQRVSSILPGSEDPFDNFVAVEPGPCGSIVIGVGEGKFHFGHRLICPESSAEMGEKPP